MKTIIKTLPALLILFAYTSCKKAAVNGNLPLRNMASENSLVDSCGAKWTGFYASDGLPNINVSDHQFISKGIAQLTAAQSPYSYFYSGIDLEIPDCRKISGDSIKFVARLKNPSSEVGSITDYDVSMLIYGSKDVARVSFIAFRPQFTYLGVGPYKITNSSDLLYLYNSWSVLTLTAKDKVLSISRDGTVIKKIGYTGTKIGQLKKIEFFFKGPGSVDWVKLYSYSGIASKPQTQPKLVMEEQFNVAHHSNVIWY